MTDSTASALAREMLPESGVAQLEAYAELLRKWNTKINLVSRQDIARLWSRHIDECLELSTLLEGPDILDVGSGGGLPGLVLAIAAPQRQLSLVERSARKCRFLRHVVAQLGLTNTTIINADFAVEQRPQFTTVVARAVATPGLLWPQLAPWLAPGGCVLVATGPASREDLPTDPAATIEWVLPDAKQVVEKPERAAQHERALVCIRVNPAGDPPGPTEGRSQHP